MIVERFLSLDLISLLVIACLFKFCSSTWNFSAVNLTNDVPIWRFAFWRNRAFFAVPSFSRRGQLVNSELTLLESCWPEPGSNHSGFAATLADNDVRIFPKSALAFDKCHKLSSVVALDIESRGRLWVLDAPEDHDCSAKILVYDLRRNDLEIARTDLGGVRKENLKSLVIDPVYGLWGPRAYVGDPGDESIIVYSLFKRRWWRLKLTSDHRIPSFSPTEMAISRKSAFLYLTDSRSQDLFSVDLETLRDEEGPSIFHEREIERNSSIQWVGRKMGKSSGLAIDQRGGLHYFLVTEHASANGYSILLQSAEVPCITDYRLDSQRNVWALVNLENPLVKTSNTIYQGKWHAHFRTARIFKHNSFAP
ncbi:uncharacterized protein yellow-k isoform X2 [Venturia canescens]|uniref:uncharacterized protein yellow-k isoform X2 n=1 Tax=Venturia canescens TaxID=32260 RepID=UPI001C9BC45D|nr:uncharacterized protein LOC122414297 isoform X2 [Venturia canescens]